MATDLTALINVLQLQNQILNALLLAWRGGVVINPNPTAYTFATLPTTGGSGQYIWVSNGRKPGEGVGAGTGVPAFWNSVTSSWFSYLSGLAVTV